MENQQQVQGQQPQQLQIKVQDADLKGAYSNLMQIAHGKEEFILDFFFTAPPQGILTSRVVLSPAHAKRMSIALLENIKRYEDKFGKIAEASADEHAIGFIKQ